MGEGDFLGFAMVINFPKCAHCPLNSKQLPIYDATKLVPARAFSVICMKKSRKMPLVFNGNASSLDSMGSQIGLKWTSFFNAIRSRELSRLFWLFINLLAHFAHF